VVRDESQGRALRQAGVEHIFNPFTDAADHAAQAFAARVRAGGTTGTALAS